MIKLEEITWDNMNECINLKIKDDQKEFIESNMYGLAQAYVALLHDKFPALIYAIFSNNVMIGFTMMGYELDEEDGKYSAEVPYYQISRFGGRS